MQLFTEIYKFSTCFGNIVVIKISYLCQTNSLSFPWYFSTFFVLSGKFYTCIIMFQNYIQVCNGVCICLQILMNALAHPARIMAYVVTVSTHLCVHADLDILESHVKHVSYPNTHQYTNSPPPPHIVYWWATLDLTFDMTHCIWRRTLLHLNMSKWGWCWYMSSLRFHHDPDCDSPPVHVAMRCPNPTCVWYCGQRVHYT